MKNNDRTWLYERLPLELPLVIQIFSVYACNFKCEFCVQSLPDNKRSFLSDEKFLSIDTYKQMIDDITLTNRSVKKLTFVGYGEPLLHPQIVEMVSYAKEKNVADTIEILTNAACLSEDISDGLINAGLNSLRVSIEGLNDEDYKKHVGVGVSFERIVSGIRYYYNNCGNASKVYVKIMDYMLNDEEDLSFFHNVFDPIAHVTAVENLHPLENNIDYAAINGGNDYSHTQDGDAYIEHRICPQPFYRIQINPDGKFVPCCASTYPILLQPDKPEISKIWNGEELTSFRLSFLRGETPEICKKCKFFGYIDYPEDILDGHEDDLIVKYEGLLNDHLIYN